MSYVVDGDKEYVYVREEIANFAIEMEKEMKKKDNKYDDTHRGDINFLIAHLKEERDEVDHEIYLLETGDKFFIKTELVHEAIMAMLVSNVIEVRK